jgi:hypothetical protein
MVARSATAHSPLKIDGRKCTTHLLFSGKGTSSIEAVDETSYVTKKASYDLRLFPIDV